MINNEKINISDKRAPVVLLAPLDWGLGHATRCIPLIRELLFVGCEVIVASEGRQQLLLKQEFTNIRFIHLKGYRIKYSNKSWKTIIKIIFQAPGILKAIRDENKWLKLFVQTNSVDAVISDNRYGLYCNKIKSVFMTHQLTIKTPFGNFVENAIRRSNYRFISRFNQCWIPDFEGANNLGGALSHPEKPPATVLKYLGRLSRISTDGRSPVDKQLLILLSGPEPQRTIFEQILLDQIVSLKFRCVIIRGLPGEGQTLDISNQNIVIFNHLTASALNTIIGDSDIIISRSGYSTVMDLMGLSKKCIFVPTPGQPEQEYLAKYLSGKHLCISFSQKEFSLPRALEAVEQTNLKNFEDPAGESYKEVLADFVRELEIT